MFPSWPRRFARDPMVHFAIIGAALFALDRARTDDAPGARDRLASARHIEVTADVTAALADRFHTRMGRAPTPAERGALIDDHVTGEILYREARALGLDRGDPIIRRRLIQRMEFLAEDLARRRVPVEDDLIAYLASNAARYRVPARVTGEHVFLRRERAHAVVGVLDALRAGTDPRTLGDPFVRGAEIVHKSQIQIAATFGDRFAERVMALSIGDWSGPIESAFGVHVVRIDQREDGRVPELAEIRARVLEHWRADQRAASARAFVDDARGRYQVIIAGDDRASDGAAR